MGHLGAAMWVANPVPPTKGNSPRALGGSGAMLQPAHSHSGFSGTQPAKPDSLSGGGSGVQLLCFLGLILSFGTRSQAEPVCFSGQLWGSLQPWAQWLILGHSLLL